MEGGGSIKEVSHLRPDASEEVHGAGAGVAGEEG